MVRYGKLSLVLAAAILILAGQPMWAGTPDKNLPGEDDFVAVKAMPEQLRQARPEYPADAKKKGVEGDVMIKACVDSEGKVVKASVSKSSGFESLDESALKAAFKTTYKPAIDENGQPAAVWVTYKVSFRLDDKEDRGKVK